MADGSYNGRVVLVSGVSLYGGYARDDWSRDPLSNVSRLTGSATAVFADGVSDVTMDGFTIEAIEATVPGASSIGVHLLRTTSLVLSHNLILAGRGSNGASGAIGGSSGGGAGGRGGIGGYGAGGGGGRIDEQGNAGLAGITSDFKVVVDEEETTRLARAN